MNRRRLLALSGTGLASAAGCLSGTPDGGTDGSNNATDNGLTGSPTGSPAEGGVRVSDITVRKAVTYESMMGSGGVLAGADRQYVVASVRADRRLSASAVTFETDERSWTPGLPDTAGAVNHAVAGREGGPVGRGSGGDRSYLAFAVPSPLPASNPRIEYAGSERSRWPLPPEARDRLAAPAPRFELDSLTVPDTVSQGDPLPVSLTARNVSETDGRFLAALYWPTKRIADDDESRVVEREVAAGDDVTVSLEVHVRDVATPS